MYYEHDLWSQFMSLLRICIKLSSLNIEVTGLLTKIFVIREVSLINTYGPLGVHNKRPRLYTVINISEPEKFYSIAIDVVTLPWSDGEYRYLL